MLQQNIMEQLNEEMTARIQNELNKQATLWMGNILGIQVNTSIQSQQQTNPYEVIMGIVNECNSISQHYSTLLVQQQQQHQHMRTRTQDQHQRSITQLQQKLQQLTQSYEHSIQHLAQQHQAKHQQYEHMIRQKETVIEELREQLGRKESIVGQYMSKITQLQGIMEKYQYQLQDKDAAIAAYRREIQDAVAESERAFAITHNQTESILRVFEQQVWTPIVDPEKLKRQQQILGLINTLCQHIPQIQPQIQPQALLSGILQIIDQITSNVGLGPIREQIGLLETAIGKLVNSHKHQNNKYQSLSAKYVQFLKETQSKIQQYKYKIKHYEQQNGQLTTKNSQLVTQLENISKQNTRVLQSLETALGTHKEHQTRTCTTIAHLQSLLAQKQQSLQSVAAQHQQQSQRLDKYIQSLTLEIQSLRESISTLQNVVYLGNDQDKDKQKGREEVEAGIVQQMMDKTYEIRLDNVRLRDQVEEMEGLIKDKHKVDRELVDLKAKVEDYLKQNTTKTKQIAKCIDQVQQLTTKIRAYEQQLLAKQSQIVSFCSQLEAQTLINTDLSTKLSQATTKISQKQQQLQNAHLSLSQLESQALILADSPLVHEISLYQKLELQRLEIYVLGQINHNLRKGADMIDAWAQVDFIRHDQEEREEYDRQTLRSRQAIFDNIRSRRPSAGCLINTKRQILNKQNSQPITDNSQLLALNKTCKIRNIQPDQSPLSQPAQKYKAQVEELNDIINYMINYIKGYTRNGIRKYSWLASQGEEYLLKVQTGKNIKQKYGIFQRVRTLMGKNSTCKQLVRDYQNIANFYFGSLELARPEQTVPSVAIWQSFSKEDPTLQQTLTRTTHKTATNNK